MHIDRHPSESIAFQTYLHYDVELTPDQKESAFRLLEYAARSTHPESLGPDVRFDIQLEDGSLKGWVTAFTAIYFAVAGYGSFRSGIDFIVQDCKFAGNFIINAFENRFPGQKLRTERRTEAPGKILKIYKDLDRLSSPFSFEYIPTIQRRIERNLKSLDKLLSVKDQEIIIPKVLKDIEETPVRNHPARSKKWVEQLYLKNEETEIPWLEDKKDEDS